MTLTMNIYGGQHPTSQPTPLHTYKILTRRPTMFHLSHILLKMYILLKTFHQSQIPLQAQPLSALITKLSRFYVNMTYFRQWSRRQPVKSCLRYRSDTYLLRMKPGGLLATAGGTTKPDRCVDLFRVYSRKLVLFHESVPLLMLLIPVLTQLHRLLTLSKRRSHILLKMYIMLKLFLRSQLQLQPQPPSAIYTDRGNRPGPNPNRPYRLWNSRVPSRHRSHTLRVILSNADPAAVLSTHCIWSVATWTALFYSGASVLQHSFLFTFFYLIYRVEKLGLDTFFRRRSLCFRWL